MHCWFDGPWLHSVVLVETGQMFNKFQDKSPALCRLPRSGARVTPGQPKSANISPGREVSGRYRIVPFESQVRRSCRAGHH